MGFELLKKIQEVLLMLGLRRRTTEVYLDVV